MTQLPLKAKVYCTDGEAGSSAALIIDPISDTVTHLVVNVHAYDPRVVPLEIVEEADHDSIHLTCSMAELSQMPSFDEVTYIGTDPEYMAYAGAEWSSPYVTAYPSETLYVAEEKLPPGELAVHRGDPVEATDGKIGNVGEFVVDLEDGHITGLVLQKGHLWGKREVTIALKYIDRVEESVVYLNLDKEAVNQLPAVKIKRHYPWQSDD
jgi:sporulation protein YlmC with PRC-barrel domain